MLVTCASVTIPFMTPEHRFTPLINEIDKCGQMSICRWLAGPRTVRCHNRDDGHANN